MQITVSTEWLEWMRNKALAGDCKGIVRHIDKLLGENKIQKARLDSPPESC